VTATLLKQVKALSINERAELAQLLWESLIDSGYDPQLTSSQQVALDRRLKAHAKNPDDIVPWEIVKASLDAKYGKP
jgi:putative addiction module component (TIGR02574 family)